jgi:hypothetical protein
MEIIITLNNIMNIYSLCNPAFIYLVIAIIFLLITIVKSFNMIGTIITLLFMLLWTWVLNYLCINGYSTIAWILLIILSFGLFKAI